MHGLKRFTLLVLLVPAAVVLVAFAVANRTLVTVAIDPFGSGLFAFQQPLYRVAFATLAIGVLIGGLATWLGQGKWRRAARLHHAEAARLKGEAERRVKADAAALGLPALGGRRDAA